MLRQFAVALRHLELATHHPASNQGHWSLAGGLTVVLGHCAVCSREVAAVTALNRYEDDDELLQQYDRVVRPMTARSDVTMFDD